MVTYILLNVKTISIYEKTHKYAANKHIYPLHINQSLLMRLEMSRFITLSLILRQIERMTDF